MEPVKCFFLEPTDRDKRYLRRYSRAVGGDSNCSGPNGYHNVMVPIGEGLKDETIDDRHSHFDARWPTKCEKCGYAFKDEDVWQLFRKTIYKRTDTGELVTLYDAPPGAMWYADWMPQDSYHGPDGHCLVVKTPGGDWMIDGRASNCTIPDDNVHKCWVRHGVPPNVTVNKEGNTCKAGGGSIQQKDFHGFLTDGMLRQA